MNALLPVCCLVLLPTPDVRDPPLERGATLYC
ncbi:hypothetical protein SAMN05421863_11023 [Nitrosomonas communis]|uniref:Uncharacterized protein n=1 Tax=Nitrosomonas communis TaxID=44574 RepID=A0A1I4W9N1_9PROT|nr:hypothetical protein SAMN05421863_11023 [Nitrosomonas communis]